MDHIENQPILILESSRGYTSVRLEDELYRQRKIFLTTEVNTESASSVIKQLMVLNDFDDTAPISLYISSPGGSIDSGMAIIDVIKSIKAEVDTICIGLAASMGAVIFSCGKRRIMYPSAKLLIHDPLIMETGGSALQIKAVSDSLLDYRNNIGKLLADNCGKKLEEILELTSKDTFFNAKEAVDFGLATEILSNTKGGI